MKKKEDDDEDLAYQIWRRDPFQIQPIRDTKHIQGVPVTMMLMVAPKKR